jgi:two-component system OmpR family sensor kinase
MAVTLVLFCFVLYLSLRSRLWSNLDPALVAIAQTEIASAVDDVDEGIHIHDLDEQFVSAASIQRLVKFVQVTDPDGVVVLRSGNLGRGYLPYEAKWLSRKSVDSRTVLREAGGELRMVTIPFTPARDGRIWVMQVATTTTQIEDSLEDFVWLLFTLATGTLVLNCFGGIFLANQALKPVRRMTQTVRDITTDNLSLRLQDETDDEIGMLARFLNEMLDRIENAFETLRRFTANASHEIRSPLTVLRGDMEVALRKDRSADAYRQVLQNCTSEVERLAQMTTDLLTLARADSGRLELSLEHQDVSEVVSKSVLDWRGRITPSVEVQTECCAYVDPESVRRVVTNLLDNSDRHTDAEDRIVVSVSAESGNICLVVTDTGTGIAPDDLLHVFERFYRGAYSRGSSISGSGLGLPICKEIVEAHQGRIEIESPVEGAGKGTRVRITLPDAGQMDR